MSMISLFQLAKFKKKNFLPNFRSTFVLVFENYQKYFPGFLFVFRSFFSKPLVKASCKFQLLIFYSFGDNGPHKFVLIYILTGDGDTTKYFKQKCLFYLKPLTRQVLQSQDHDLADPNCLFTNTNSLFAFFVQYKNFSLTFPSVFSYHIHERTNEKRLIK